jgi:sec-independent protein translocase protein TatA
MDLFDSWWKVLILVLLLVVLFGAKKLPGAAKSLGQSMRIFKSEMQQMHDEQPEATTAPAPAEPAAQLTAAPAKTAADQQAQIDALQQQIRDMQRASAMDPVSASKQDDI